MIDPFGTPNPGEPGTAVVVRPGTQTTPGLNPSNSNGNDWFTSAPAGWHRPRSVGVPGSATGVHCPVAAPNVAAFSHARPRVLAPCTRVGHQGHENRVPAVATSSQYSPALSVWGGISARIRKIVLVGAENSEQVCCDTNTALMPRAPRAGVQGRALATGPRQKHSPPARWPGG